MKLLGHKITLYLRLYLCYAHLNLIKNLSYRMNFVIGLMINLAGSLTLFYFYDIVFDKLGTIGSWDKSHAMVLAGTYMVVESFYVGIAFHSVSRLPRLIVEGDLDSYLIRPVSTTASLAFEEIDYGNILNALFGIGVIYYFIPSFSISALGGLAYFLSLILGIFFLSCVLFLLMSLAFWLGRVEELRDSLAWIIDLGNKPAFVYPKLIRNIFYWVLPLFLMANIPVEFLMGERRGTYLLLFALVIVPFYLLTKLVWKQGLKKYSSASY